MARGTDMAQISQYVAESTVDTTPRSLAINPDAPNEPVGAPVPESAPPPSANQLDEQIKQAKLEALQETAGERASIREMRVAQLEADRIREEENARERAIAQGIESVQDTISSVRGSLSGGAAHVGQALGSIPIPGDIVLPLTILLIFFFALVQIGGHTRLMWLWLTLTGNASIGGATATTGALGSPTLPTEPASAAGGIPRLPTEPAPTLPKFGSVGQGEAGGGGLVGLVPLAPFAGAPNLLAGLGALFTGAEEIL